MIRIIHIIKYVIAKLLYPIKIFTIWVKNFVESISQPEGWKIFAKIFIGIYTIIGVLVAFNSYLISNYNSNSQSLERAFYYDLNDMVSNNKWVRINALRKMRDYMIECLPDINVFPIFLSTKGISKKPVFHNEARRAISRQLQIISSDNALWSTEELKTIIEILEEVGSTGWYYGEKCISITPKKESLSWIWEKNEKESYEYNHNVYTILSGVRLDNISLMNYDLAGAYLNNSTLKNTNMKNVNLDSASLEKTDFSSSILEYAQLVRVDGENIILTNANLNEANISNSLLKGCSAEKVRLMGAKSSNTDFTMCNLTEANLSGIQAGNAIFNTAILSNAIVTKGNFSSADFSFSKMENIIIQDSNLSHTKFNMAEMKNASLKGSNLTGANFCGADLRGADFDNALGLVEVAEWHNANIAGLKGIDINVENMLRKKGAVVIQSNEEWAKFNKSCGQTL